MQLPCEKNSFCQPLSFSANPALWLLRDDLIHPQISGNKWRKLKYNIQEAQRQKKGVLTFGGAFSNHIAATAAACQLFQLPCVGIIRGEAVSQNNPTLSHAAAQGMQLHFVSRKEYAHREMLYEKMTQQFPEYFLIPEGGANSYGILGAGEITKNLPFSPDYFVLAVGTATTLIGILKNLQPHQKVIGISVLAPTHTAALRAFILQETPDFLHDRFILLDNYHFGGYAKTTPALRTFVQDIFTQTQIPLDLVYTGKMCYAALDLLSQHFLAPKTQILLVHTGGLQGNQGFKALDCF